MRDNSMKLTARRKRRRGSIKKNRRYRAFSSRDILGLHRRTNCSQKRSDPYFTLNPHLPRRMYARLCRKPPPRGCINSIRPPVSDGTASRVKTAKWGEEKERRKKISRMILPSFTHPSLPFASPLSSKSLPRLLFSSGGFNFIEKPTGSFKGGLTNLTFYGTSAYW